MTPIRYVGDIAAESRNLLMRDVPSPVRRDHLHKCGECGYATKCSSNYTRHYRSLHTPGGSRSCCGREFSTLYEFNQHKLLDHAGGEYRCLKQDCSKVFNRKADLERHLESHDQEKRFVCTTCSNRFSTAFNLRRHQESSKRCKEVATARTAHQRTPLPLEQRNIDEIAVFVPGVYTGNPAKASTGEAAPVGLPCHGCLMIPEASVVENHENYPWTVVAQASVDSLDHLNGQVVVSARSSSFSDSKITDEFQSFPHACLAGLPRGCCVIAEKETRGPDFSKPSTFPAVRCGDHYGLGDAFDTSRGKVDPTVFEGAKMLMFLKYGNHDVNVPQ
ncbi:hypothetical protein V5799_029569 [Amblyomma americanum]|uniref:C2H2-type domain-containing protein n=1 Tax=Amblyomma americanum TaxID=6943 RepID=A0AAQ4EQU1_AMBAM